MSEYKRLELGSLVKLAVNTRGITNGSIDILSFEYDINSEIDKIVEYVDNNDFPELKNEVNVVKEQNDILEDKIKNFALEILTLQGNAEQLNQLIQEYNLTVSNQYNNLVTLTYQILNKLEPKIIYKDKIVIQKEYIQTEVTYYKGVKTINEVRQEQEVTNSRKRPKQKYGWFEYSDEWMVNIIFDKESFFMNKKDYQKAISLNIAPGGYGTQYPPKLFHKLYDK
jgi:hypothetical protein